MINQNKIPGGWQAILTGDVFTFVKSYAFPWDSLGNETTNKGGVGNIHYGDIHAIFSSPSIDLSKIPIPTIKEKNFSPERGDLLKDGDLVMADTSEDYDGVGKTISVHGVKGREVVGGLHTYVLRDDKGKTTGHFRKYIFRNPEIRKTLQKVANGVSVYGISKQALSTVLLTLPSLAEQQRIVDVLETWDKYLENLDKKIAAKNKERKGIEQQLLAGLFRLPGYSGRRRQIKLNDITNQILDGTHQTPKYVAEGIPFYSVEHITANDFSNTRFISENIYLEETRRTKIEKGDILMSRIGDIGTARYVDWDVKASFYVTLALIKCKTDVNSQFIAYLLNAKEAQREIWGKTLHVAFPNKINLGDIKTLNLSIPPTRLEQNAIADILSSADEEIGGLEKKRGIVERQKRFLLNNLITGQIRLPEFRDKHE